MSLTPEPFAEVLVPLDGSHESERTVDPARTWAAAVLHEGVTAR